MIVNLKLKSTVVLVIIAVAMCLTAVDRSGVPTQRGQLAADDRWAARAGWDLTGTIS